MNPAKETPDMEKAILPKEVVAKIPTPRNPPPPRLIGIILGVLIAFFILGFCTVDSSTPQYCDEACEFQRQPSVNLKMKFYRGKYYIGPLDRDGGPKWISTDLIFKELYNKTITNT